MKAPPPLPPRLGAASVGVGLALVDASTQCEHSDSKEADCAPDPVHPLLPSFVCDAAHDAAAADPSNPLIAGEPMVTRNGGNACGQPQPTTNVRALIPVAFIDDTSAQVDPSMNDKKG